MCQELSSLEESKSSHRYEAFDSVLIAAMPEEENIEIRPEERSFHISDENALDFSMIEASPHDRPNS